MSLDLNVKIGNLKLKNPIMVASGTFGYAEEIRGLLDLKKLGAIVSKTITLRPRRGNSPPRTCETAGGMLNSIGLENPGVEIFIAEKLPYLRKLGVPIIVSIASEANPEEFVKLATRLDKVKGVSAIELNLSCPNLGKSKIENRESKLIAQDRSATYQTVKAVRKATKKTLVAKLSPNVTDIKEIAKAAQAAGADAVSLINTLVALAVDIETRRPELGNITGGLSGPAIKPVALNMVREVYAAVKIPIIGMGGIMTVEDA
ncbi:MAG: dihydroorotate dehydrogenase, partial [Candidatus Omnitrophota bacterium]